MNFIIRDLGSADLVIIQSENFLRVREQDAAHKGTRCCAWVSASGNEQLSATQLHNVHGLLNLPIHSCTALAICVSDYLDAAY